MQEAAEVSAPARQPSACRSFTSKYLGGFVEMFTNKTCLFVVLGGCFRFWQGYVIAYFTLEFFADYQKEKQFGVFNSLAVLIGGFSSNFFGARISDKLESRYH